MPRFLHTADWQLGLKLRFVPGDRGAKVRNERFEVVRRLAALAHEHAVQAVVVAGDVFDDNNVGPHTLQATRDALLAFAPIPVLLLPGNHDHAAPECALARLVDPASGIGALPHVRVLLGHEPVRVGDLELHPCPLLRRHERTDPTAALPQVTSDHVHVAIAHGGVLDFSESTETPNRIDAQAVLAKGYDYLALGDWHGLWNMGPRVWYSGAPEATRFIEKQPGHALLVDIEGPGAEPAVTPLAVARTRWLQHPVTLSDDSEVEALDAWLAALPERAMTLVELWLEGSLSLAGRARLDKVLAAHEQALLHLRVHDDQLFDEPSEHDLATLTADGFVGAAAADLHASGQPDDRDALRLLHRFLQEADVARGVA